MKDNQSTPQTKTRTRGNVIVEDIKIGDIHYEYEGPLCIKSKVIISPFKNEDGNWTWKSKALSTGREINYIVNPNYTHYSSKLYNYEAYEGCQML